MKAVFILIIAIFLFLFFRSQHTAWPEVLVYPYLLNNGFLPYKDLVQPYTPGFLWFTQVVTQIFGYAPQVSQFTTLVLLLANSALVYFFSKSIWKTKHAGNMSTFFYLLWVFYFEGNGLWFELLITPLALSAFYFFYKFFFTKNKTRFFILGSLALALAFIVKQSSLW